MVISRPACIANVLPFDCCDCTDRFRVNTIPRIATPIPEKIQVTFSSTHSSTHTSATYGYAECMFTSSRHIGQAPHRLFHPRLLSETLHGQFLQSGPRQRHTTAVFVCTEGDKSWIVTNPIAINPAKLQDNREYRTRSVRSPGVECLLGEYSGLSLVCHQYAAFKRFAPQMDIGINLSREYEAAQEMFQLRSRDA